ncbi:M24 family metallopeptidase [Noviherbaspirillum sp. L7-7A]|nr:M24 family metallopeptidase [Noviherbaspirillum sp. L7-7A]MBV0881515.1 M24 family metallopeptidase [Noviherbaspirillum sp. L7-7A]
MRHCAPAPLAAHPGATLGDIRCVIQTISQRKGFCVVREFCGRGIGKVYHDELQVLYFVHPGAGLILKPGIILTVAPMFNAGKPLTKHLANGWNIVTIERSLSAQQEQMVALTESGIEMLTVWLYGNAQYS